MTDIDTSRAPGDAASGATGDDAPLFEPYGERGFAPSVFTRGPWDPSLQHGGPVAALFATLLEREAADGYQPARLTVDLMRPVPVQPLEVGTRVVRTGKRLQLLEGVLAWNGTECARASLLALRREPVDTAELNPPLAPPPDEPDSHPVPWAPNLGGDSFVGGAMDFRLHDTGLGQGVGWLRLHRRVLPGVDITPLARAAAASDVGNAVSARRTDVRVTFVNADLSLSLSRLPEGEWIRLAARSRWEPSGVGWVTSEIGDRRGQFGAVSNALVLAPAVAPLPFEAPAG